MDQSTKSTHLLQVRQGKGIHVAGEYIEVSNNARNIVVIFYSHVSLEKHVMHRSNRSFNMPPPPPGIPRAFDTFAVPGRREFDHQSLPGGGEFDPHSLGMGNLNSTLDFM